jgi:transposase
VEDDASCHGTNGLLNLEKAWLDILRRYRPASSPDPNPIETIWRILKQRIEARYVLPNVVGNLKEAIREELDRLQPEGWNVYKDSMQERLREVRKRKRLAAQYQILRHL